MTQQEYLETLRSMKKAEESTTPYAVPTEDEIVVVGDANKTELNKNNFTVLFWIPEQVDGEIVEKDVEIEYKDVYITPRQAPRVVKAMNDLYPFYKKITEQGTGEDYSDDEIMNLVAELPDEIYERMYTLVATTLGVDPVLKDYMDMGSVMSNVAQIFRCVPGNRKRSRRVVQIDRFKGESE